MTDEYGETELTATGYQARVHKAPVLTVSGGDGNEGAGEVHLMLTGPGSEFAQGWFSGDDLLTAVLKAKAVTGRG